MEKCGCLHCQLITSITIGLGAGKTKLLHWCVRSVLKSSQTPLTIDSGDTRGGRERERRAGSKRKKSRSPGRRDTRSEPLRKETSPSKPRASARGNETDEMRKNR